MQQQPKKQGFNPALCGINDIQFIVCKNIKGVVTLLTANGYDIEKMKTVDDVYRSTNDFLMRGGQEAQEKLMLVHPHRPFILEAENTAAEGDVQRTSSQPVRKRGNLESGYKAFSELNDDELMGEKNQIENTLKNPPPNARIDSTALNARLKDINAEFARRLNAALGKNRNLKLKSEREEAGVSFKLTTTHLYIIAGLIVLILLFKYIKK